MEASEEMTQVSRNVNYSTDESATVFRIAWYAVASKPNVLLEKYNEAESQVFNGQAKFSLHIGGEKAKVGISVDGAKSSIGVEAEGKDEIALGGYLDGLVEFLNNSLTKYESLPAEDKAKLKRALVAKTCWDRVVREILDKAPSSNVYYQVAHGREMMIKAFEGDDEVHPITLTTSGWLSQIESLPRDQTLPGNVASELAKKSIEWKRETQEVIGRYL
ncbi:MAG: hypothetical protein ACFFEK_06030 [Candidatus Thorarchaeota archaeon]